MKEYNLSLYEPYADRMAQAKPKDRPEIIAEMCKKFGFKKNKAYQLVKECGWDPGRKKRIDAGTSKASDENVRKISSMKRFGTRKNGKETVPTTIAYSIAMNNGIDLGVGLSRINQKLREQKLSSKSLKPASPHTKMRSLYPNHVHQVDPSVYLGYFTPNKLHLLKDDEVYKNKPLLEGKEHLKCWRYVLTDHCSGTICVRYYQSAGEKPENLYDFLLYAWGQKENPAYIFHGLPEIVLWDKGSANKSKQVKNALGALRVNTETHAAGNPRGKGSVEVGNNIVETHFECLIKFEPVHSLEQLNEAA
jgi:hypothetical protein